jgi:predicted alpha/beta superfamily hydrolase
LHQKLTFELTTTSGDKRPVYICGNFNNWKTNDPAFLMQELGAGKYRCEFTLPGHSSFPLEYKYVRGSWDSEELNEYGSRIPNRRLEHHQHFVADYVPQWEEESFSFKQEFLPRVQVISEGFSIPQLITTRRIAALLPYDYDQSDKRYPVLYLQDGQNLFNEHAPFGNWAVDKRLALLAEERKHEIIVISIDHAEKDRIMEFTPTYHTRLGRGEGKKYARFLADTLKPYIDSHFRTLPDRINTGIGGSSMGALISIYAGLMYPEVYSKLMVFSPSLWVAPNIPFHVLDLSHEFATRLYLYAGGNESDTMVPNMKNLVNALREKGWDDAKFHYKMAIDPNGKHNEACWGEAFPDAVKWLYFEQ